MPRVEHGYCVDDVARGLLVLCREPSPRDELITLARRYLYFLTLAQAPDGRYRNRLGYDRRWRDQPGTGDCWGRALWGLGTAAARGPTVGIRGEALALFDSGARVRSPLPHAMAFAVLGAAEVLAVLPGHQGALSLLEDAVAVIGEPPDDAAWPWPTAEAELRQRGDRGGGHRDRRQTEPRGRAPRRPAHAGVAARGRDPRRAPVGGPGRRLGPGRAAPRLRPAADRGRRAGGRVHPGGGGDRRRGLAGRRRPVRGVVLRRQRRQGPDARRADRRRLRRPGHQQPQPQPGGGVNAGDDLGAAARLSAQRRPSGRSQPQPAVLRRRCARRRRRPRSCPCGEPGPGSG